MPKPKKQGQPRKRSKAYNWAALKAEYLSGEHEAVADFARSKAIALDTIEKQSGGWREERKAYQARAAEKALQKAQEAKAATLARHAKAGKAMLGIGIASLAKQNPNTGEFVLAPTSAEEAARVAKIGADIERSVLILQHPELRGNNAPVQAVQVNVNEQPDTAARSEGDLIAEIESRLSRLATARQA